MTTRTRILVAATLLAGALAAPTRADAAFSQVWINPGIKLAYTLGEGFTYGFELSTVFLPAQRTYAGGSVGDRLGEMIDQWSGIWGIVLNVDRTTSRVTKLRLGAEWVGPGIGIEGGPTLILDGEGHHWGIGVTPWAGFFTMPYYTYTFAFGRKNMHELGMYLKYYRCVADETPCGDSDDPDLD